MEKNLLSLRIAIPSKGRAGKTKTTKLLESCGIPYYLFVEPQDLKAYSEAAELHCFAVKNIERNGQGISYARQSILNFARLKEWDSFWMLDDDIQEFGEVKNGKTIKQKTDVLLSAQNQLSKFTASLYSLQLRQFAWSGKELVRNRIAMQCVLFNMKFCKTLNYDMRLCMREDYDLSMQAIFNGCGTLRTSRYYYGSDDMKAGNPGGMTDFYTSENEKKSIKIIQKKWPGIFTEIEKENRFDVKIDWKKIPK